MANLNLGCNIPIVLRQRRFRATGLCVQAGFELLSIIIDDRYQQNEQS